MLFHQKTEYFNISSFSLSMVDESLSVDEIMLFIKKAEECEKQSKILQFCPRVSIMVYFLNPLCYKCLDNACKVSSSYGYWALESSISSVVYTFKVSSS